MLALGRSCSANRSAIDAGAGHADEKQPVKPSITSAQGTKTDFTIQFHARSLRIAAARIWPFSDIDADRDGAPFIQSPPPHLDILDLLFGRSDRMTSGEHLVETPA